MRRVLACCLCLLAAAPALAQKRFYTVVEPDGSIRTVESDEGPAPAKREKKPSNTAAEKPAKPLPVAPPAMEVDGETFVDADALLEQAQPAEAEQKRFYILRDAAGARIEESDGAALSPFVLPPAPVAEPVANPLSDDVRFWSWAEAKQGAGLDIPACLAAATLKKSVRPLMATEISLAIDKASRAFVQAGQVLAYFRVPQGQPADIWVSSYSVSQSNPVFLVPPLAFLRADGCVSRVVTGYMSREFPSTNQRHPERRGHVTLLSDEAFVLVIMPDDRAAAPEGARRPGRIGIRWQALK